MAKLTNFIAGMLLLPVVVLANGNLATSAGVPLQAQTLQFDSSQFGWHGPMAVGGEYSDKFGWVFHTKYSNSIGSKDALAIAIDLGMDEFRSDFTWGHAITPKQWFKITGEHLSQTMNFDFASGQDNNEWMPQEAVGAAYQYLILHRFIKSAQLSGYYAHSKSRRLDDKAFSSGGVLYNNIRRIAGAVSAGLAAGVDFQIIPSNLLGVVLNYDSVNFDNKYEPAKDAHGFGITGTLEQLISDHLKVNLKGSHRQPYDEYAAGITWLAHTRPGTQLEFGISGARSQGKALSTGNENRLALNVSYHFGGDPKSAPPSYGLPSLNLSRDLTSWTAQPAVHMAQVMVMRDQKITKVSSSTHQPNVNEIASQPSCKKIPTQQRFVNSPLAGDQKIALGNYCSGGDLQYALVDDSNTQQLLVNKTTGVITGPAQTANTDAITVNIANTAGSYQAKFNLQVQAVDPPTPVDGQFAENPVNPQGYTGDQINVNAAQDGDFNANGGYLQYTLQKPAALNISIDKDTGIITGPAPNVTGGPCYSVVVKGEKYTQEGTPTGLYAQATYDQCINPVPTSSTISQNPWISIAASYNNNVSGHFVNGTARPGYAFDYTLQNNPSWLTINNSGVLSGVVANDAVDFSPQITAQQTYNSNITGLQTQQGYSIYIKPSATQPANLTVAGEGDINYAMSQYFASHRAAGSSLFWTFSFGGDTPEFLNLDANTGLITGTAPAVTTDTNYAVTVIATKALPDWSVFKTVRETFTLTVTAPVPPPPPPITVTLSCPGNNGGRVPNWTVADSNGTTHTFKDNQSIILPVNTFYLCGQENPHNPKCHGPQLSGDDDNKQLECYYVRGQADNPVATKVRLQGTDFQLNGDTVTYTLPQLFRD